MFTLSSAVLRVYDAHLNNDHAVLLLLKAKRNVKQNVVWISCLGWLIYFKLKASEGQNTNR